jgi:TPR repeat protein
MRKVVYHSVLTCIIAILNITFAHANSIESLQQKAFKEDANAQYLLGLAFETGDGVARDITEATKWYQKASIHGHRAAMHNYAMALQFGRGVSKNPSKAALVYTQLAALGDQTAYGKLAKLYESDSVVFSALDNAVLWYALASEYDQSYLAGYDHVLQMQFDRRQAKQMAELHQRERADTIVVTPVALQPTPKPENHFGLVGYLTTITVTVLFGCALFALRKKGYRLTFSRLPQDPTELYQDQADIIARQKKQLLTLYQQLKKQKSLQDSAPSYIRYPVGTLAEAYLRFGFSQAQIHNLTPAQVKARYKQLSRIYHPDTRGSDEEMKQLNSALKTILDRLKKTQNIH